MASTYAVQGFQLLQSSRPQDGVAMFEKGLKENPKDPDCLLGLSRVGVLEGNAPAAKPYLQRLLEVNPMHSEAKSHLALVRYMEGDKRAVAELKSVANTPGAGVFEQLNLARVLNAEGDGGGAEAAYRRAILLEPRNAFIRMEAGEEALRRNDARAAVEHLETAAQLAPNEYVVRVALGQALREDGQAGRAAQVLRQAVDMTPNKAEVLAELFQAHFAAGAWQEALNVAQQLKQANPKSVQTDYFIGLANLKLNKLPEAKKALEAVVAAAPKVADARQALAQVLMALKQPAEAKKALEAALQLAPDNIPAANDLALLYFDEQPDGLAKAEKVLRQALKVDPDSPTTNFNLAVALEKKDPRAALVHAKKAQLSNDPAMKAEAGRKVAALTAAVGGTGGKFDIR